MESSFDPSASVAFTTFTSGMAPPFLGLNTTVNATAVSGIAPDTALLDTNILVYAYNADSEYHTTCRALLDRATKGELNACLAPQILFEFFAVVTNPARVAKPITPTEALDEMTKLADSLSLITPPMNVHDNVINLMRQLGFGSKHIYDVVLAATMLSNGVARLYTYDVERFQKIPGIRVLDI
ncbi:PIN domain-containing protein [Candidatus Uhrbacteria bacterium]|nr:PIN domain-containing protein [Candidatus Uhrbacteria bacterium]